MRHFQKSSRTLAGLVCVTILQCSCDAPVRVSSRQDDPRGRQGIQNAANPIRELELDEAIATLKVNPPSISRPLFIHDAAGASCILTEAPRLHTSDGLDSPTIRALKKFGSQGIESVLRLFQGAEASHQAGAVLALAVLDGESAATLQRLLRVLITPPHPALRVYAANALAALGDRAIADLTRVLGSPDPELQQAAAFALGLMGPSAIASARPLAETLEMSRPDEAGHNHVGAACAFALRQIGVGGLPAILAVLKRSRGPTVELAASSISLPGDPRDQEQSAKILIGFLEGATAEARVVLGNLLSRLRSHGEDTRTALRSLMADPISEVRLAGALAWSNTQADFELGIRLLTNGLSNAAVTVRAESASGLGRLGSRSASALPNVLSALSDVAPEVRLAAAKASIEIAPDPSVLVPALANALSDADPLVSNEAANALAKIGPPALPDLEKQLRTASEGGRSAAATALGRIKGEPSAIAALSEAVTDPSVLVRRVAVSALRRQAERPVLADGKLGNSPGAKAIPAFVDSLNDDDAIVREIAAEGIGTVGPEARFAAAKGLLVALKDGQARVRRASAFALEGIGYKTSEVVPVLIEVMEDAGAPEAARERAARLLFEIDPEARPSSARR